MAASVLNSDRAIEMSVYVARAFVQLRELLGDHQTLADKLTALEQFRLIAGSLDDDVAETVAG